MHSYSNMTKQGTIEYFVNNIDKPKTQNAAYRSRQTHKQQKQSKLVNNKPLKVEAGRSKYNDLESLKFQIEKAKLDKGKIF